jgi:protein tyrosine/serine phosphatase
MLDKIQIPQLNLNISQKKANKKTNIPDYPADEFVRSNSSLSFKGVPFTCSKVSENFLRGSKPDVTDLKKLKDLGVKAIVDLVGDGQSKNKALQDQEKKLAEELGMKYFKIPLRDDEAPEKKHVDDFLEFVKKEENLPVFVHCRAGKDRTGLMTAIYAVDVLEQSFRSAYRQMLESGHDFYASHALDKFFEKYCEKKEDPSYIRETAKSLRRQYFKKLNETSYYGNLSREDLDTRYA